MAKILTNITKTVRISYTMQSEDLPTEIVTLQNSLTLMPLRLLRNLKIHQPLVQAD